MFKVGYYKDDLETVDADTVNNAAETFAEENHEICEESDHKFTLYVEDGKGILFTVNMFVEYDPRYEIESSAITA